MIANNNLRSRPTAGGELVNNDPVKSPLKESVSRQALLDYAVKHQSPSVW